MKDPVIVSIGLPVYNGQRDIGRVIESLLSQTFTDFELVISDNCSTDTTPDICHQYAAKDSRIRYIRQPENIGALKNFSYVLECATGRYFMWAAADDIRSENFLAENVSFLETHPDYVGSTCPVRFEGGTFDSVIMGDASLDGSSEMRLIDFFSSWHANGRYYGIFRAAQLKKCHVTDFYLGNDWMPIFALARDWKYKRLETGFVELGSGGVSNNIGIFDLYRKHWYQWIFPFGTLTKKVFLLSKGFSINSRCFLIAKLLKLNVDAAFRQYQFRIAQSKPDYVIITLDDLIGGYKKKINKIKIFKKIKRVFRRIL